MEDISALIGMSVTVYADQNDRKKYYVDIVRKSTSGTPRTAASAPFFSSFFNVQDCRNYCGGVIALKFSVGTVLVIMGLIFLGVGAVIMTVGIIMFFDIFALIGMSVTVYADQNDRGLPKLLRRLLPQEQYNPVRQTKQ